MSAYDLFNQADSYLQQVLGESLAQVGAWKNSAHLPRYITQIYEITKAKLAGMEVVLMASKDGAQTLPALLKQRVLIEKKAGIPVIWVGNALQAYARKEMVARRMPFIIPFKQVYLPLLGVKFQEQALATRVNNKEKLHVATQVFLINALLGNLPDTISPKEIAMSSGYSLMTMTRIKSELMEHGWLDIDAYKNRRVWRLSLEGNTLWDTVKPHLQNPVRKRIWLRNPPKHFLQLPLAGLSALAEKTMLGEPPNTVRAIGEMEWRSAQKSLTGEQILPESIEGTLELEVWRYAPARTQFKDEKHDFVDPYSLFLSLENMNDDRVRIALTEVGI